MKQLSMCLFKEYTEVKRRYKIFAFVGIPLALVVMVLASLIYLPILVETLPSEMFTTSGGSEEMAELLKAMLPNNVSGSLAMYGADMGLFYLITVIALTSGVVTKEIKKKQWILPVCGGIKPQNMLLAKYVVYGLISAVPAAVGYALYYMIAVNYFERDMKLGTFLACAGVFFLAVLWVSTLSIGISVISKRQWISAASMISTVLLTPDFLYLFKVGRVLPTFLLTYVYNSGQIADSSGLFASAFCALFMMVGVVFWSLKKV